MISTPPTIRRLCLSYAVRVKKLSEFQTNLVPYPRIHFVISSYAPVISAECDGCSDGYVLKLVLGL